MEEKLEEGPTETQILNTYPNKGMMVIMVPGSVLPLRIVFLFLPQKQLKMWMLPLVLKLIRVAEPGDGGFGNPEDARAILANQMGKPCDFQG